MTMEDSLFYDEFERRYQIPAEHTLIKGQRWCVSKWDIDMPKPGKGFIDKMEALMNERDSKPLDLHVGFNIITNNGMEESSKRDTNDSPLNTTGVQYIQTGTSSVSELPTVSALGAAHGSRNDIDVVGERVTVNQTSKYGAVLTDVEVVAGTILNEAGLFNDITAGTLHAYIAFTNFTLNSGERIVFQINELMQNGTV